MKAILQHKDSAVAQVLYMAMELSNKKWKLGFSHGGRIRVKTMESGDWSALQLKIKQTKSTLHCTVDCHVVSCYEADRVDVGALVRLLMRYVNSEETTLHVIAFSNMK